MSKKYNSKETSGSSKTAMTIDEYEKNKKYGSALTVEEYEESRKNRNISKETDENWDNFVKNTFNHKLTTQEDVINGRTNKWPTTTTQKYEYRPADKVKMGGVDDLNGVLDRNNTQWNNPAEEYTKTTETDPSKFNQTVTRTSGYTKVGTVGMDSDTGMVSDTPLGKPTTLSASDLEEKITQLETQATEVFNETKGIDKNLDPQGYSNNVAEFRSLTDQINSYRQQLEELVNQQNEGLTGETKKRPQNLTKKIGNEPFRAVTHDAPMTQEEVMEAEISALQDEYDSLVNAAEWDETSIARMRELEQQIKDKKAELTDWKWNEAVANSKYMPEIMARYGTQDTGDGTVTMGGVEVDTTPYNYYEGTEADERGETADEITKRKNYMGYYERNPFAQYEPIAEKENWKKTLDDANETSAWALDELGAVWNAEDPELTNIDYYELIEYHPDLVNLTQEEYDADPEKYDRELYNYYHGNDPYAYDHDIQENPTAVEDALQKFWEPITSGKVKNMDNYLKYKQGLSSTYEISQSWYRTAQKSIKEAEVKEKQLLSYEDLIDLYDDDLTMTEYNPDYDKGTRSESRIRKERASNDLTANIDRIYSFVNGGYEYQSYMNSLYNGSDDDMQVSADYQYAMMMLTGEGGGENEVAIFTNLYNQAISEGREPTEAQAFLDGLQPTLRARYSDAEKIGIAEFSRQYPVVATAASLAYKQMNTYVDAVRHLAHAFGDESVEDPNSAWYYMSRFEDTALNTISKDISTNYGSEWGEAYISVVEGMSNLIRALAAPKGSDTWNSVVGLIGMWMQVDQESTYKYLNENMSYTEASFRAFLDATEEVAQEFLPYETMLSTKNMSWAAGEVVSLFNEIMQEVTGATVGEKLKGIATGEYSSQARIDEIVTQRGYYDDNGNWIDLSNTPDDMLLDIAKRRESAEHQAEVGNTAFGAALGSLITGSYGTIARTADYYNLGKRIKADSSTYTTNNPTNTAKETTATEMRRVEEAEDKAETETEAQGREEAAEEPVMRRIDEEEEDTEETEETTIPARRIAGAAKANEAAEKTKGETTDKKESRGTTEARRIDEEETEETAAETTGAAEETTKETEARRIAGTENRETGTGEKTKGEVTDRREAAKETSERSGVDTLVGTALGMKGTRSQRNARDIEEKRKQGKEPSNYTVGKLAATMAEESGEALQTATYNTVRNRVYGQMKNTIKDPNTRGDIADAMARVLTTGKMSVKDRWTISRSQAAIELFKSYNTKTSEDYQETVKAIEIETEEARSIVQTIQEVTGDTKTATGVAADEVNRSNEEAGGDVEKAIDNFASRRSDLMSEEYAEEAKEASKTATNKKSYLGDAVKIRIHAYSGNTTMPKTSMDSETANRLWTKARAEYEKDESERVKNQAAITPGKGTATFEGSAYGTDGWKNATSGLDKTTRRTVNAIAWIAKQTGNTIHFVNRNSAVVSKSGKIVGGDVFVHGWESSNDGSITINVAGLLRSGAKKSMMVTIAHEMTHWLEQNSTEGYAALRSFILKNLREQGMDVEQRLVDLMDNQRSVLGSKSGKDMNLSKAMAEVVAQSCEELMTNKEMITKLAGEEPGLYEKVSGYLRKLWESITSNLTDSLSEEAKLLHGVKDEIAKYWLEAREEALGRKAGGAAENTEDGIQFSVTYNNVVKRDKEYFDNILKEHPYITITEIRNPIPVTKNKKGFINSSDVLQNAFNNPYTQTAQHGKATPRHYAFVPDLGIRAEIAGEGIKHGFKRGKQIKKKTDNAMLAQYASEILQNAVEVNRGIAHQDTAELEHVMVAGVRVITGNNTEDYGLRIVIQNPKNKQPELVRLDIIGVLHSLNEEKTVLNSLTGNNAARASGPSLKMTLSDFFDDVKNELDDIFAEKVYTDKGTTRNRTVFSDNLAYSVAQVDQAYMDAVKNGDMDAAQHYVNMAAERAGYDIESIAYHGTQTFGFTKFDMEMSQDEIFVAYRKSLAETYTEAGKVKAISDANVDAMSDEGIYELFVNPGNELVVDAQGENWNNIYFEPLAAETPWNPWFEDEATMEFTTREIADWARRNGYDSVRINNVYDDGGRSLEAKSNFGDIGIFFHAESLKSADTVTYDDNGNVIPPSKRFNTDENDIRYSVAQLAQANGMKFDEDELILYDKHGRAIDGVDVKVTEDMIEKTPIGMLINMARDGVVTKKGKVKFAPTISAETAKAQKKMFTDLMNMVARYKNSNLVWEIAGSTLYSALKSNSDPQYSTTVDFGTVCAKTQEIINVMSRVMLEKGRGLTREEVLEVYNQTANAGLTVPCPVCYVFSRWMGVPSLLNQMSQYQKRFVALNKDGSINVKKTQANATKYISDAMAKYGSKENLDKAKTSITNRMKTQEKNRTEALVVLNSKTATAEEKSAAKTKHDAAIKQLDELTKDLGEVEAYNWVTQALCREKGQKGSGKYEVDPEFELTPDEILFDLRKTGEFAKYTKNWRYRNTRGAGMGKAIMPYSGMSIGDIIFGTERKSELKNPFLTMKEGGASNGIKNAIIRARKQNLIGGQRLQSTSDFRPEWGLDYLMTFLELQAIGSKVQMYTKVAEAVDLLASMNADVNLSIMGKGSGFHEATEEEIRLSKKNTKAGRELKSRMGETADENGVTRTYVLDFSDVTGMDYNTAKELKNNHHSVQMILVGMNDIHIRLALANPDIDFVIPWHSSGNSQDALKSMIKSVGEKLETSSDYTDYQTDKVSESQTEAQKQLWELRMKILQGKNITEAEKDIIDKDDWLSDLYERFNTEGVDPDCYQVELGKEQAEIIFPYEYWDKSLTKAQANRNGQRFIAYCEHFGIIPRFSQFMEADGYWKVLIDRPMYDNNGRYREQQVVDVTKAKIGTLNEQGQLTDSAMPLKTSAMYGEGYSEQEKTATDNTLAALDMKAQLQAIGSNVLEEEESEPRRNQSVFGASAGVPTMNTQATSEQEVFAQNKARAMYANEDSAFSVVQPDMEVASFMEGLNEASLTTYQEKAMLRQWKEANMAKKLAEMEISEKNRKLKEIQAKGSLTAFDREEIRKINNRISDLEKKRDKAEESLAKATQAEGYAKLMQQQESVVKNMAGGRTIEEVRAVVEQLMRQVNDITKEMEAREREIQEMRGALAEKKQEALVSSKSAARMAKIIKQENGSDIDTKELIRAITEIRLKIMAGQNIDQDVEDLAWKIAQGTHGDDSAVINALRGTTIVLGPSQMEELKGTHRTLRDVRSDLAGTGIKVTTGKTNTLDSVWGQLCGMISSLDPKENSGDQLNALLKVIRNERKAQSNADMFKGNMESVITDLKAMIAAVELNVTTDPAAREIINRMNSLVNEMAGGAAKSAEELKNARRALADMVDSGAMVLNATDAVQRDIRMSIRYNNALAEQSEAALWKNEKWKLIEQLKDKNTEALIKEQQKWKEKIAKDKAARDQMQTNQQLRKAIHTNITRMRTLLLNETDQKNIPEHMKSLAREVLDIITRNDLNGRKITGIDKKDLIEMDRVLRIMNAQDGSFTTADLAVINDAEVQSVILEALADIEDGILTYNGDMKGNGILKNLENLHDALDKIAEGVATIKSIIDHERELSYKDRKILVADAAGEVVHGMQQSRHKGELRGAGSRQISMIKRAIGWGNLTPVYFFKNLRNHGMMRQWKELTWAENRNGLELQKAASFVQGIAEKYHYKSWADQKVTVKLGGRTMNVTAQQIMSLYAIWQREKTMNPEMSNHLQNGGVYFQTDEQTEGKLRREIQDMRPVRISDEEMAGMYGMLSDDQKGYLDDMVRYLSNDMSDLGNEASMRMYGIKKYKETWYFPMQVWDGVKSARSDKGISGTNENRAAHKSWSKRRKNMASNALVIGNFTDIAVGHIVEMINYNTIAPAIENINKVLNYQENALADDEDPMNGSVKRNVRIMFQQAYGKDALNYLETFLKDLNGGTVQDQRKTLREAALSMFKKNAVAGSASVALQQPLSYIRAAMMINPVYLAQAISPTYWKGSHAEMLQYSGVAVIKEMGRFDMNFGRSARDYVSPEENESVWAKISDKLTEAPEKMDMMTWTRMWSAVKIEIHKQNPRMDMKSEKFLTKVAERFNEVMQATQVYDSVMVKSQNMRSDKFTMKLLTSFMAEPTLSLNVLADAVQNIRSAGGKTVAAKAGATFLLSAIMQSLVKGLMGSGRSPDEKKTWLENFLYKWWSSFISEANPFSLIPGYSDMIELFKNGELTDDAMGALGKLRTIWDTTVSALQGNGKGWYRDLEDTVGQMTQLFTGVPAKNLMRDGRAVYNWATQEPYAERENSGAVIRQQSTAAVWNADNMMGLINSMLGDAGYKTTNSAYYNRLYDAMQRGNESEAAEIREYLTLGKGVSEKTIESNLKSRAKKDAGLIDAMDANSAEEIGKAIDQMMKYGTDAKTIKSQITTEYKERYLSGDSEERRKIRDAMQKAYKKLGSTAEDANKIIDGWVKNSNKKK